MKTTFVTEEHGYLDYDVTGAQGIHRACVPAKIKKGDLFNVYCFDSSKFGCTWQGDLEKSLELFTADDNFKKAKMEFEGADRAYRLLLSYQHEGDMEAAVISLITDLKYLMPQYGMNFNQIIEQIKTEDK